MSLDTTAPVAKPRKAWLAPTNQRRWENFKANRRGYWSLWLFLILFFSSLMAEFIANDRPIIAVYKGEILVPVLVDYPEEKFGGFLANTDYRSPFISDEINANGWMLWPPVRYSYQTGQFQHSPLCTHGPLLTDERRRTLLGLSAAG